MDEVICQGCVEREGRIADLERRVTALEARNRQLEDLVRKLLGQDPPPPPSKPPRPAADFGEGKSKTVSGRKPGGQPKHPPHLKQLLPAERVTHTVPFVPTHCECCQEKLSAQAGPKDPEPTRHQVAELPDLRAKITEYQGHSRTCPKCQHVTHAAIPADKRSESVDVKLAAMMSYLVGVHHVSKRGVEEIVEEIFEVPISLGKVSNLEQEMSEALKPVHEEAVTELRQAPSKYVDETGWKKAGLKRWLWAAATQTVAVFLIHARRNLVALTTLLGTTIFGIVHSDRWKVYNAIPLEQRQVCWAHLRRNFEKLSECGSQGQAVAEAFAEIHDKVFEMWHLFRGGGMTRQELGDAMASWILSLLAVLETGARCRHRKVARFCKKLREVYPALWTFVVEEGVDPTNNQGERVQRLAVLWRKCCFGCHSEAGCRFVERLLTAVQSLRLQKRSVLEFLTDALKAYRTGQSAPHLVPAA